MKYLLIIFLFTAITLSTRIESIEGIITYPSYAQTNDGNGWALGTEFEIGDEITIIFDNRNTKCIYDDEIIFIIRRN